MSAGSADLERCRSTRARTRTLEESEILGIPMSSLRLLAALLRVGLLIAVLQTHYMNQAVAVATPAPNNICQVEETIEVPQLEPLCLQLPRLCPQYKVDKRTQLLSEKKTILVEKCCPGFSRTSEDSACEKIKQLPTSNNPSDNSGYMEEQDVINTGIIYEKLLKAISEGKLLMPETETEETYLEPQNYDKGTVLHEIEQTSTLELDESLIGIEEDYAEEELRKGEMNLATDQLIYAVMALSFGGMVSLVMILFNILLFIIAYKSCRSNIGGVVTEDEETQTFNKKETLLNEEKSEKKAEPNLPERKSPRPKQRNGQYRRASWRADEEDSSCPQQESISMKEFRSSILNALIRRNQVSPVNSTGVRAISEDAEGQDGGMPIAKSAPFEDEYLPEYSEEDPRLSFDSCKLEILDFDENDSNCVDDDFNSYEELEDDTVDGEDSEFETEETEIDGKAMVVVVGKPGEILENQSAIVMELAVLAEAGINF